MNLPRPSSILHSSPRINDGVVWGHSGAALPVNISLLTSGDSQRQPRWLRRQSTHSSPGFAAWQISRENRPILPLEILHPYTELSTRLTTDSILSDEGTVVHKIIQPPPERNCPRVSPAAPATMAGKPSKNSPFRENTRPCKLSIQTQAQPARGRNSSGG